MVIKVLNNGSCVNREVHAQFCEGLVGKFHWSTRPLTEGLAGYYELFYSTMSWKSVNSSIKHAFSTMVNSDSRKENLDEVLNSDRQFFANQKINLYSVGYSLIRYLQEKNFTLILDFFTRLVHLMIWEKFVNINTIRLLRSDCVINTIFWRVK